MTAITGAHPYAEEWPIRDDVLGELTDSIRENGQRFPIIITPDGLILDGRTRYQACMKVGIEPLTEVYEGDDLADFVIDANAGRRHESTGVRAMIIARILIRDGRRENRRWVYGDVRQSFGPKDSDVMAVAVSKAGTILDFKPDLATSVVNGVMALDAAYKKAVEARDAKRNELAEEKRLAVEEADARVFVEANDAELAAQVGDGPDHPLRTYVEAMDVWKRRNAEAAKVIADKQAADKKAEEDEARIQRDKYTRLAKALQVISLMGEDVDLPHLMDKYDVGHLSPPSLKREFTAKKLGHARDLVEHIINWEETKS